MKKILLGLAIIIGLASCEEQPTDEIVKINTEFGEMHLVLYDETPIHKQNFLKLAKEGFYDSTTFHRIIENFMIQGGDPNSKDDDVTNDGNGGPGYTIEAEFNKKFCHKKGALAAARMGDQQNPEKRSSGSQFYIVQGKKTPATELDQIVNNINMQRSNNLLRDYIQDPQNYKDLEELKGYQMRRNQDSINILIERLRPLVEKDFVKFEYTDEQKKVYAEQGGTPFLDANYTVYGEVISGLEVVDKIAVQPKGQADRPIKDIKMSVTIETMKRKDVEEKFGYVYPEVPAAETK